MKDIFRVSRMWRPRGELKRRYDVVIIGGGSHGLATAYYLARNHGITNVAVLEQSYIGSGASGRNTTIIRANYRTPEGAEFYQQSVKLYEHLSAELDFNLMFAQRGHLTLAHSDRAMTTMQERAEVNQLLGIDSRVVLPPEIARLCPELDLSNRPTWPILGALHHPQGGIIRHDAVVWGLARGADRHGVEIHPHTTVTGIEHDNRRVTAVETNRGRVEADVVISAVAGWSTLVCGLAGIRLPITTHILQAFVTEPVKPFLDVDHRLGADARLRLADRPRRVPDRRRDRALHHLQVELGRSRSSSTPPATRSSSSRSSSGSGCSAPGPASATSPPTTARSSGRPSSRLPSLRRLGHLRLQSRTDRRHDARRARRARHDPHLDRPFALERFHTDTLVSELAAAAVSH